MEEMSLEQGLEEIGHKILVLTRNELYMKMRFMDVALSAFYYVQDFSVDLLATDGETMYFNGQMLGGEYRQNRIEVNRAYLHLVLHCIFRHVFRRNGREELVWNLAADIAVDSYQFQSGALPVTVSRIYEKASPGSDREPTGI